jgi:hypothetical protein
MSVEICFKCDPNKTLTTDPTIKTCPRCFRSFRGNSMETIDDEQDRRALEPPYVCPPCEDAEHLLKRKRGDKTGYRRRTQPVDGKDRKCSICFGTYRDSMRVQDWKTRKFMKLRLIARGMSPMDDFKVVDIESGNELAVVSLEVLPILVDGLIQARVVIYLEGGFDIEAQAAVTVRAEYGKDDPTAAGRAEEQARRLEHFKT